MLVAAHRLANDQAAAHLSQVFAAFSPAAFALAISAHAAGIRAIFLIGTASARLKREPFAALYACGQIQIAVNRQEELSHKRVYKGVCTNEQLWRGAQPVAFQKQIDWREVYKQDSQIVNYLAEITCHCRFSPKLNASAHLLNICKPRGNVLRVMFQETAVFRKLIVREFVRVIFHQETVAISEVFNPIFGEWRLRKLKECGRTRLKKVNTPRPFGTGLKHSIFFT
jgi:hypothetical protein